MNVYVWYIRVNNINLTPSWTDAQKKVLAHILSNGPKYLKIANSIRSELWNFSLELFIWDIFALGDVSGIMQIATDSDLTVYVICS